MPIKPQTVNRIAIAPAPQPASHSWWIGKSRADLQQQAKEEQRRMSSARWTSYTAPERRLQRHEDEAQ